MTNTAMTDAQRLDRLESIEEIKQLKARYCAACDDDHDPDKVEALFVEDGIWEATGIARCEGHTQIREFMTNLRASGRIRNSAHQVMNPVIDIDGDEATGHWRLLMMYTGNVADGSTQAIRIVGWYQEKYIRVNGKWMYKELFCRVEEDAPYALEASRMT